MSLKEKLEFKKKIIEKEKNDQLKESQELLDTELNEQFAVKQIEKKEWEENLTGLESGYKEAQTSLADLKSARKSIDDIYNNPDYKEVIGDQKKDEFITGNAGEPEIQDYRQKESKLRDQVGSLTGIKKIFKDKLPELDFRGGKQGEKSPREESIRIIKEKIGVMDKEARDIYEQTTAGQKELEEKRKKEIIARHDQQTNRYNPDYYRYTGITAEDLTAGKKWGEEFVKGAIVEFNHNKIDEKYGLEMEKSKFDKQEDLVNFSKEYFGRNEILNESLQKITDRVKEVANKLDSKFAVDEELKKRFSRYFSGSKYDNLATFIINDSIGYLEEADCRGDNPSALRQGIENLSRNQVWEKVFSTNKSGNSYGSFNGNLVRTEYVKQLINYYQAGIDKLESYVENNPRQLLEDNDQGQVKYVNIKREISEDIKPDKKEKYFNVDQDLYTFFGRGENFNEFKHKVEKKLAEIEKNKQKDYSNVDGEIENNWLEKEIQLFEKENKEVLDKNEKIENKKIVAQRLLQELLDIKYTQQADEEVVVKYNEDQWENKIFINTKEDGDYNQCREEIERLEKESNLLVDEKNRNQNANRNIFNKKKLDEKLNVLNKNLESTNNKLSEFRQKVNEYLKKQDFFHSVRAVIYEKARYSRIEFPAGEMKFSEFMEKTREKLRESFNEKLSDDEQEKINDYQELKNKLEEVYKAWGGKKVWPN